MMALAKQIELTALTAAPDRIYWGCHDSPLGPLLLGVTGQGLCRLEFVSGYGLAYDLGRWAQEWPSTRLVPDAAASAAIACQFRSFSLWGDGGAVQLALYGTEFQLSVWKALLQIEPGEAVSHDDIAALVGKPGAGKAVGMAISANPVPLLIPCHRVIEDKSKIPLEKKRLMLALERIG